MDLVVGYEENGNCQFFVHKTAKTPDISKDTKLFGRPFLLVRTREELKKKLKNFLPFCSFNNIHETFSKFKDETTVYLFLDDHNQWYAYDCDWKRWGPLTNFYYLDQLFKEGWVSVQ